MSGRRTLLNALERVEDRRRMQGVMPADMLTRDPEGVRLRAGPGGWSLAAEAWYHRMHLSNMTRLEIERSNRQHELAMRLAAERGVPSHEVAWEAHELLREERPDLWGPDPEREALEAAKREQARPLLAGAPPDQAPAPDPLAWALDGVEIPAGPGGVGGRTDPDAPPPGMLLMRLLARTGGGAYEAAQRPAARPQDEPPDPYALLGV